MRTSRIEPLNLVGTARCAVRFFTLSPIGGEGRGEAAAYDFLEITAPCNLLNIQSSLLQFMRGRVSCRNLPIMVGRWGKFQASNIQAAEKHQIPTSNLRFHR